MTQLLSTILIAVGISLTIVQGFVSFTSIGFIAQGLITLFIIARI